MQNNVTIYVTLYSDKQMKNIEQIIELPKYIEHLNCPISLKEKLNLLCISHKTDFLLITYNSNLQYINFKL